MKFLLFLFVCLASNTLLVATPMEPAQCTPVAGNPTPCYQAVLARIPSQNGATPVGGNTVLTNIRVNGSTERLYFGGSGEFYKMDLTALRSGGITNRYAADVQ
ncbi:hypothetical protein MJH12_16305, partial [bacterium]|nr:hypothetical protein [bacterium]